MGINPGNPAFGMPPAEDDQVRKQRDMERTVREDAALTGIVGQRLASVAIVVEETRETIADAARVPATPTGMVATSTGMWNSEGVAAATIAASWDAVTLDVDGAPIVVGTYELWAAIEGVEAAFASASLLPMLTLTGLDPESTVTVTVRVQSQAGVWSAYSAPVTVTTEAPATVLAAPTTPVATSQVGAITLGWDGLLADGPVPKHFGFAYAEMSATLGGLYVPVGQSLIGPGTIAVTSVPIGTTAWFRFRAVDKRGVISDPSAAVSAVSQGADVTAIEADIATLNSDLATLNTELNTVSGVADSALSTANGKNKIIFSTAVASGTTFGAGDIWFQKTGALIVGQWEFVAGAWAVRTIDSAVIANLNAAKIVAGTITTDKMTANTINGDRITANTIAAAKIVANSITANEIATNAITVDELAANSITAAKIVAGSLDAFLITGANIQTLAAASSGVKINSSGVLAYNASGVQTFSINSATGAVAATGDFTSGSGNSIFKATTAGIQLGNATFASAPFRVTAAGALFATGATISGTINATAGTFSGNITSTATITGGTFQTATAGQRVVLGGTSLRFYSPNGAASALTATNSGAAGVALTIDTGLGSATFGNVNLSGGGSAQASFSGGMDTDALYIGGRPASRVVTRAFTVTTDANGLGTITHTLGEIPDGISLQFQNYSGDDLKSQLQDAVVWGAPTATAVTFRFLRRDTNAWFGVNSFTGWLTVVKN